MSSLKSILNPAQSLSSSTIRDDRDDDQDDHSSFGTYSRSASPQASTAVTTPSPSDSTHPIHPPHPNCPDSLDCLPDTDGRPQHTLPVILRCAILGSPRKRLTIRDIYAAMEGKYPYYRTVSATWKQSVRHHLSLNRLFERQARPVTEPGFGSYWTVNLDAPPGTKRPRKRGRTNKTTNPDEVVKRGRPRKNKEVGMSTITFDPPPASTCPPDLVVRSMKKASPSPPPLPPFKEDEEDMLLDTASLDSDEYGPGYSSATKLLASPSRSLPPICTLTNGYQGYPSPSYSRPPQGLDHSKDILLERMRAEIDELRRQNAVASSVVSRLSDELAEYKGEIASYRVENQVLHRKLDAETTRRLQAEAALRDAEMYDEYS